MIRSFILYPLLLLLLATGLASAQNTQRVMQGYVTLPGESPRHYRIVFTAEGTKISGYSVTANDDLGEMKATITGTINQAGTEIYIRELTELDHNSTLNYSACFFTARLRRTERNGKYYYSGTFDSRMTNGQQCENGIMVLIDKTPPRPKPLPPKPSTPLAATPRPAKLPTPRPRRDTVRPKPAPSPDTPKVVPPPTPPPAPPRPPDTAGKRPLYRWKSNYLTFDISDGWDQDGDVVSIYFNNQVLLDHVQLTKDKKRFSVPLPADGVSTLKIELHGEGNVPPNTPSLQLIDGDSVYDLAISGNLHEVALLYFTRL